MTIGRPVLVVVTIPPGRIMRMRRRFGSCVIVVMVMSRRAITYFVGTLDRQVDQVDGD